MENVRIVMTVFAVLVQILLLNVFNSVILTVNLVILTVPVKHVK